MPKAKIGDVVKVHYHGRLTDGTTFDTSEGREPLEFQVGAGRVIPGFDKALKGMEIGEKKTIQIPVAEAYGEERAENFMEYPIVDLPDGMEPFVGMELHISDEEGHNYPVVISEVKAESIVLNANHPLAGKDLIFDIELVEIK